MARHRRVVLLAAALLLMMMSLAACSWSQPEDDPSFRPLVVVDSTVNTTVP